MSLRRVALVLVCLFPLAPPVLADRKPFGAGKAVKQAPRTRSYDVLHYRLAITFDLDRKAIEGEAKVTFQPLHANFRTLALDFEGLSVRDVARESAAGGGPLRHAHEKGVLSVDLGAPAGPDDTVTVRVRYGGSPAQGLYFVGPDDGYPKKPRQCWSQGETEFNHYWFPCWDHPNDRATSEELYTVPAGFTAVGNGRLVEVRKEATTWTWQWRQEVAYPSYLASVCVGKFETATEDVDGVRLEMHVPEGTPDAPATTARSFAKTGAMIRFYNSFLGFPYPYPRYAQTCVVDFLWGGMENISATTLTADTLHDAAAHAETESEPLVAHELAHQWFGDLVTCKTWGDIWLNEGFASYLEALWREKDLGRDEFLLDMRDSIGWYMGEDQEYRRPVSTDLYADPDDLFDGHTYAKGARVLWMLHALVGDEAFRAGLKLFLTRHREQCVETDDLRRAMEEITKRDLAWFFDQWIRKPGYPEFEVSWSYDEDAKAVVLAVKQVQDTSDGTPLFRAPVPVEVVGETSAALHTVWVDARDSRFVLPFPKKPVRVRFDRGDVLLKKLTFTRPAKELLHQIETDDDVTGRLEAAEALAETVAKLAGTERDDARARLAAARSQDKFHAVRSAAAKALAKLGKEAIPALLEGLGDAHPKARRAAIEALGEAGKGADEKEKGRTAAKLAAVFDSEPSPHARAAALRSLAALGGDEASRVLLAALAVPSHREMIRGAAVEGLAEMKHANALELATNLSRYGNPSRLRGAALTALEKLGKGNKRVLDHLIHLARDPFIWTRHKAYEVLGALGAPEAVPVLKERMEKEHDARLREAARKALEAVEAAALAKLTPEAALEARAKKMELEAREKELRAKKDLLDAEILAREAEKLRAEAELERIRKEREGIEERLKKAGAATSGG